MYKEKNNRKMLLFIGILCLLIFCFFYYKSLIFGNNINNKSEKEIIDNILNNLTNYKADINVTVFSNKTVTHYEIKQEVEKNKSIQEIEHPEFLKGVKIELEDDCLKIINTNLNLVKIYEKYESVVNNSLFLSCFIEDYKKNESKVIEENDKYIVETKLENSINTYAKYKELHISKKENKIKELNIKDDNKKVRVNIKYNNIEIK